MIYVQLTKYNRNVTANNVEGERLIRTIRRLSKITTGARAHVETLLINGRRDFYRSVGIKNGTEIACSATFALRIRAPDNSHGLITLRVLVAVHRRPCTSGAIFFLKNRPPSIPDNCRRSTTKCFEISKNVTPRSRVVFSKCIIFTAVPSNVKYQTLAGFVPEPVGLNAVYWPFYLTRTYELRSLLRTSKRRSIGIIIIGRLRPNSGA